MPESESKCRSRSHFFKMTPVTPTPGVTILNLTPTPGVMGVKFYLTPKIGSHGSHGSQIFIFDSDSGSHGSQILFDSENRESRESWESRNF